MTGPYAQLSPAGEDCDKAAGASATSGAPAERFTYSSQSSYAGEGGSCGGVSLSLPPVILHT